MTTTLITGAGLIGCLTASELVARGERVLLLDRSPAHDAVRSIVDDAALTLVEADVTDFDELRRLAEQHGVRRAVHTAALLSTAIRRSPTDGVRVNVVGTANVLELARQLALERVVLASSTTVAYPTFGEFDGAVVPEDFALRFIVHRPASIYAATKVCAEHLGLLYRDLYGVEAVSLRYAAVIGAWRGAQTSVPGRLLALLLGAARRGESLLVDDPLLTWKGGEEFIDARDCATANVAALDAAAPAQGVYNVGAGVLHSFDDLVACVRKLYPALQVRVASEPRGGFAGFAHVRRAASDLSAARRELGWAPGRTLADSVRHFAPHIA